MTWIYYLIFYFSEVIGSKDAAVWNTGSIKLMAFSFAGDTFAQVYLPGKLLCCVMHFANESLCDKVNQVYFYVK